MSDVSQQVTDFVSNLRTERLLEPLVDAYVNMTANTVRVFVHNSDDIMTLKRVDDAPPALRVRVVAAHGIGTAPCSQIIDDEMYFGSVAIRAPERDDGIVGSLATISRKYHTAIVVSMRVARYLEQLSLDDLDELTLSIGLEALAHEDDNRISVFVPDTSRSSLVILADKTKVVRRLLQFNVKL